MKVDRVRDAAALEASIPWHSEYSVATLILYTGVTAGAAVLLTCLTAKVIFRYNNCRW